jgi:hypothetical protein
MITTKRTQEEIDELLNSCVESEETGESKFFGMTYEQGIIAAIDWLFEDGEHPLEE